MTNAKHTPEPWILHKKGHNNRVNPSVEGADKTPIASCGGNLPGYGCYTPETYERQEANARRIVAAVNACKGINTETLERGTISEMRHVLGETVIAAADLDAAIGGVTDQFDAERNRLNALLRAAQSVLHSGMALDLHELLANRGQIALIWSIKDVQDIRSDLSDEQAWEVLDRVEHKHDATLGVTWDTLETVADDLFGDAPETDSSE